MNIPLYQNELLTERDDKWWLRLLNHLPSHFWWFQNSYQSCVRDGQSSRYSIVSGRLTHRHCCHLLIAGRLTTSCMHVHARSYRDF